MECLKNSDGSSGYCNHYELVLLYIIIIRLQSHFAFCFTLEPCPTSNVNDEALGIGEQMIIS